MLQIIQSLTWLFKPHDIPYMRVISFVQFKKQQLKMRSKHMFKGQNKSDLDYDKTIDMRDSIMRNVKYEYLKRLHMPHFKRDVRRFIIEKRNIKDPSIQMAESLISDFDSKKYVGEFMEYFRGIATHDRKVYLSNLLILKSLLRFLYCTSNI